MSSYTYREVDSEGIERTLRMDCIGDVSAIIGAWRASLLGVGTPLMVKFDDGRVIRDTMLELVIEGMAHAFAEGAKEAARDEVEA